MLHAPLYVDSIFCHSIAVALWALIYAFLHVVYVLVSARLSSSLPSYSFYYRFIYILILFSVHFYSEVMHVGREILETYHFFLLLGSCFAVSLSFARHIEPFYNRSGDLWYFSDGLFHIIDLSVILNYRRKSFPFARFGGDTIKSREIPFMCPYRSVKYFSAIA